jgi:hypothetical protein
MAKVKDSRKERAARARQHILGAIQRCVEDEGITGWPLAHVLGEYAVRTLAQEHGSGERSRAAVESFLEDLAWAVEAGAWTSEGNEALNFEAASSGLKSVLDSVAAQHSLRVQ